MNQVQGTVNLFVEIYTGLDKNEFLRKFQNIVAAKLQLIDSHGERHEVDFVDIMKMDWINFEEDGEAKKSLDNGLSSDQIAI